MGNFKRSIRRNLEKVTTYLMSRNYTLGVWLGRILEKVSPEYQLVTMDYLTNLRKRVTVKPPYTGHVYSSAEVNQPSQKITKKYPGLGYNVIKNAQITSNSDLVLKGHHLYRQRINLKVNNKYLSFTGNGKVIETTNQFALIRALPVRTYKKGVFFGGRSFPNWYHWLIQIMSRVELLEILPETYKAYPILIPEDIKKLKNHSEVLHRIVGDKEVIYLKTGEWARFEELIWLDMLVENKKESKLGRWNFNEKSSNFEWDLMQKYRRRIFEAYNINKPFKGPKRIFFARRQHKRPYNQEEIIKTLEPYNFQPVYMEDLTIKEQIEIAYHAEFMVGPTGAAWTNLLFAKQNGQGLIFSPEIMRGGNTFTHLAVLSEFHLVYYYYPCRSRTWKEYMVTQEKADINAQDVKAIVIQMLRKAESKDSQPIK